MRLECTWILANLTFSSDEPCLVILTDGNDQTRKLSCVVEFLAKGLEADKPLVDLVTFVLGNLTFDLEITRILQENINFIPMLAKIAATQTMTPQICENITRIFNNVARLDAGNKKNLLHKRERLDMIVTCKSYLLDNNKKCDALLAVLETLKWLSDNATDDDLYLIGQGSMVSCLL
jgi:hypothetical protein